MTDSATPGRARAARRSPEWLVVDLGAPPPPIGPGAWRLALESGETLSGRGGPLPPLPLGIHTLVQEGEETTLLAAPAALPPPPRGWGLMLPLYGLRPPARGGLGDYDDLRAAVTAAGACGAALAGINPVHAGFPGDPGAISPYSPSSRRWFNTAHIACTPEAPAPGAALVDWPASVAARMECLRAEFAGAGADPAFDAWRAAEGPALEAFATHQALSDPSD